MIHPTSLDSVLYNCTVAIEPIEPIEPHQIRDN
jgi:hypothetical protein